MGIDSNKFGTASLSKLQRAQLAEFRKRNKKALKGLLVTQIVQVWRDGYICGCISGYDTAKKLSVKAGKVNYVR